MLSLRAGVFLQLQIAHADHEAGDAIGFVDRQNTVGELDGLVDIAVRERGDERAVEQFVVLRIGAKRRTIERRRRSGVPLHAGMTGGQIAARHRQRFQIVAGGELRRVVGGMIGRLRRNRAGHRQRGEGECGNRPAIETNGKHHGSPWLQDFTAGSYGSSRMRTQPAASSHVTMPLLAFNRKDTGWRIDWQDGPAVSRQPPENAFSVAVSWPAAAPARAAHAIVVTSPHNWARRRPPAEPR